MASGHSGVTGWTATRRAVEECARDADCALSIWTEAKIATDPPSSKKPAQKILVQVRKTLNTSSTIFFFWREKKYWEKVHSYAPTSCAHNIVLVFSAISQKPVCDSGSLIWWPLVCDQSLMNPLNLPDWSKINISCTATALLRECNLRDWF